jgi:hypothetical protein
VLTDKLLNDPIRAVRVIVLIELAETALAFTTGVVNVLAIKELTDAE